ncbi:MAG TPA: PD-(D/E)XK nuclease-like domain-containing protein [Acetobacteraceae bacterium]|nr:PD-(D/E)XK nuclease-like domain-containing protein [Acetobacteraceae bacterium]
MSLALTQRISVPGIYTLSDPVYLADPVIEPSLNNSTIKELVGEDGSPAHAWASHPRLGLAPDAGDGDGDSSEAQDVGHVAHQLFLHGESRIRVLNVTAFRSNEAKRLRDTALAEGLIPLKAERYDAVRRVVEALEKFRERTGAFTQGKPEQTLIWQEGRQWGRSKVDWLCDEPSAYLWDLKTTTGRASLRSFSRSTFEFGYDTQGVYYPRGAECVRGEPPAGMKFCVVETRRPYGIKVFELTPQAIEIAEAQVRAAIATWARCRETGEWPGYSDETEWLYPPYWKLKAWESETRTGRGLMAVREDPALIASMMKAGNLGG